MGGFYNMSNHESVSTCESCGQEVIVKHPGVNPDSELHFCPYCGETTYYEALDENDDWQVGEYDD